MTFPLFVPMSLTALLPKPTFYRLPIRKMIDTVAIFLEEKKAAKKHANWLCQGVNK